MEKENPQTSKTRSALLAIHPRVEKRSAGFAFQPCGISSGARPSSRRPSRVAIEEPQHRTGGIALPPFFAHMANSAMCARRAIEKPLTSTSQGLRQPARARSVAILVMHRQRQLCFNIREPSTPLEFQSPRLRVNAEATEGFV